jgi:hypothetical protein
MLTSPAVRKEENWPVVGKVLSVSDCGKAVTVNFESDNYHPGMTVVFDRYNPDVEEHGGVGHEVETIFRNVIWFKDAVNVTPGAPFFTKPRATPDNPSEFMRMDCINCIQGMYRLMKGDGEETSRESRLEMLEIEDDGTADAMLRGWANCRRGMSVIIDKCKEFKVTEGTSFMAQQAQKQLTEVLTMMCRLFEAEYADRSYKSSVLHGTADKFVSLWNFELTSEEKKSNYTELVEYFLQQASRQNLRHVGATVYEPVYTTVYKWVPPEGNPMCQCGQPACFSPDHFSPRLRCEHHRAPRDIDCRLIQEDEERPAVFSIREEERAEFTVQTKSWTPMMQHGSPVSICTWMHLNVDQHTQAPLWNKFLEYYGQGINTCDKFMTRSDHHNFPIYNPDSKMFSFQNGVYDVSTNTFYRYMFDTVPDVCCINHIDATFDPALTTMDMDDIAVPGYDDIVASQNYDFQMRKWLDIFIGRLFFKVGDKDNWEKLLEIKGWAATGKSTIAKAVSAILGSSNVGNIPSNCEEQWALQTVYNKTIWMCTELKKDWRFPPAVLQSMISGEVVPIHIKFGPALDISWRLQGLVVGNEEPVSWMSDAMNALFRRIIPFPFEIAPKHQDPGVAKRFMNNLAPFLARVVRRYVRAAMYEVPSGTLDAVLPPRLKEARAKFLHRTQPLIRFLEESTDITLATPEIRTLLQTKGASANTSGSSPISTASCASIVDPADTWMKTRKEWRIRMTELNAKFREWWNQNNLGKNILSITSKAIYDVAVKHLNVSVERDDDRNDYMYGVQPASMSGGAFSVMYEFPSNNA